MPNGPDCAQCCVYPNRSGGWNAGPRKRPFGPYATCDVALRVAIAEALFLRRAGHRVSIRVEDADGHVRAAYCLCQRLCAYARAQNWSGLAVH